MNGNRINLADIYGLNQNDTARTYSNTMNTLPSDFEQPDIYINNTESSTEKTTNTDNTENREVDIDRCAAGRCRFAQIYGQQALSSGSGCSTCQNELEPITEYNQPVPFTANNMQYLNTFIRSQIGRRVHVDFLIGTNMVEKDGYLVAVGANFILLNPIDTRDMIACDFHNIKFMKFYY